MTKAEAIKQVYEQFADYLSRGFTVAESYEKIFGEGSYSNLVDWAYDALRAKGNA
jgi:hypothetical protein